MTQKEQKPKHTARSSRTVESKRPNICMEVRQNKNAVSEDRTHDLRIMRPTRYQLRYHCHGDHLLA